MQQYLFCGCFYLFCSFQPHLSYCLGTSPAILGLLYSPKYGKCLINVLRGKNTGWRLKKTSVSCLFQLTRHCSYHSHSITKCLPPVGYFDSKYVEHRKPNSYSNYSIDYSKSECKFMSQWKMKMQ